MSRTGRRSQRGSSPRPSHSVKGRATQAEAEPVMANTTQSLAMRASERMPQRRFRLCHQPMQQRWRLRAECGAEERVLSYSQVSEVLNPLFIAHAVYLFVDFVRSFRGDTPPYPVQYLLYPSLLFRGILCNRLRYGYFEMPALKHFLQKCIVLRPFGYEGVLRHGILKFRLKITCLPRRGAIRAVYLRGSYGTVGSFLFRLGHQRPGHYRSFFGAPAGGGSLSGSEYAPCLCPAAG